MVEPNFFGLEFEFLWWILAGISVAQIRLNNFKKGGNIWLNILE